MLRLYAELFRDTVGRLSLTLFSASGFLDPSHHLGRSRNARLLEYDPAVLEHDKVRNALDVISRGDLWVLFGVHFEDEGTPGHRCGHSFHFGRRSATRRTPVRPEIHQHGECGLLDHFVKKRLVCVDRFPQSGLAPSCTRHTASAAPDLSP